MPNILHLETFSDYLREEIFLVLKVQWWRYTDKERGGEIAQDLLFLLNRGVIPVSITSDGGPGIKRAVDLIYPNVPRQRRVVHLQKHGLALVTQNPRTQAGREVGPMVVHIPRIDSEDDQEVWLDAFSRWCCR